MSGGQRSYEKGDGLLLASETCDMRQESMTEQTPAIKGQVPTLGQKCGAEFLGTAFLVYGGCGALTGAGYLTGGSSTFRGADLLGVALAFGLAISIMVYAIGHISGCHINPAVSIGLACVRRMSWGEAGAYIVAQLLGGLLGALLVAVTFGAGAARLLGYGASNYNPVFVNYFGAIVAEAIGTFFLVFVVMAMVIDRRAHPGWAGLTIGLTVAVGILVTGAVTGGNFNPARAFGPTIIQMLFGGAYPFGHLFVYIIGPIIGGVVGAFAYEYLSGLRATEPTTYTGVEPGPGD
jgi:glycerol uptake facilitator protein